MIGLVMVDPSRIASCSFMRLPFLPSSKFYSALMAIAARIWWMPPFMFQSTLIDEPLLSVPYHPLPQLGGLQAHHFFFGNFGRRCHI